MRILIGSAHPYIPQVSGGAQSSAHEMALEFQRRGHEVAMLSGLLGDDWMGFRSRMKLKLSFRRYVVDRDLGYPVYRAWFAWEVAALVARQFHADVAIFQSYCPVRLAKATEGMSLRRFIYLRNAQIEDLGGLPGDLEDVGYIANSHFTADYFQREHGIHAPVVYPFVEAANYATDSRRRNVTFINPHPHKGVDTALGVAERCPEIPFVFVRSWQLSPEDEASLRRRVDALSNVTLRPSTRNMKTVYGEARIVLAPSRWSEAFGRVAAEAHLSGIPVVGSTCGGLPEAIGPGGTLVSPEAPIEEWVRAVQDLWHDPELYRRKSEAALAHSQRPEMNKDSQISRLLDILSAAPAGEARPGSATPLGGAALSI